MPILSKPHFNHHSNAHLAFFFYGFIGCFLLGCVWQLQLAELIFLNFNQLLLGFLALVLLLIYLLFLYQKGLVQKFQKNWLITVFCALCFQLVFVAGYLLSSIYALHRWQNSLDPALEGQVLELTGQISHMVQISPTNSRFQFRIEQALIHSKNAPADVRASIPKAVLLNWTGGVVSTDSEQGGFSVQQVAAELLPGDRWKFNVKLKAVHGNSNPGGFDYELWMWEKNLRATGNVVLSKGKTQPQLLARTWAYPIERLRQYWRDQILIAGQQASNTPQQNNWGIIAALVVGDQSAIEASDWDIFRLTGVAHLVSISGLHITMFAWLASYLLRGLWSLSVACLYKIPAVTVGRWGGVVLATLYALLSGWGLPAQRTIIMLLVVALLQQSGWKWPLPRIWLLAMAVVVVQDPWALLAVGFWLSFVAVAVLMASNPSSSGQAQDLQNESYYLRFKKMVGQMLREQFIVTAALAPLSLLFFQQVSVVGLLANLLAVPWLTFVVTPLSMLGIIWAGFWSWAVMAIDWLMQFLELLSQLSWAVLELPAAPWYWSALATVALGFIAMPIAWQWRLALLPCLLPALLWQVKTPEHQQFDLWALDIGQGNGLVLRTKNHSLIYDTGPAYLNDTDAGQRVVLPFLKYLALQTDLLVLSHQDMDHSGGAASVLKAQTKAQFLSSLPEGHELAQLRSVQRCGVGFDSSASGQVNPNRWTWDGVDFEILHPLASDYNKTLSPNAVSCVLKISNQQQVVLLVADIEKEQEAELLSRHAKALSSNAHSQDVLKANVLLVPHHGSKTSSTAAFLEAVKPRFALVQAGYRNRYGHPAPVVSERYQQQGIELITSPQCGAAYWSSALPAQIQCHREQARRYWHHSISP